MKPLRRAAVVATTAALTAGTLAVLNPTAAQAHGAPMAPGSRTYLCWQDGLSPQGNIVPQNPACAAAVAISGANSLYNWFSVLRSDAAGRTVGYIPDGQLCSGGNPSFAGYDLARTDWPVTHLTAGAMFNFKYSNWAHHPGTFYFYVTKDGWDPTRPLRWSDLEEEPFLVVTDPPQRGGPGTNDGHYYFSGRLPANKSGRHIIYSRWVRSDSPENFFGCSDVVFDGGNGEVTGIGGGSTPPTTPPSTPPYTPPTTPPSTPPSTPPASGNCVATMTVTNSWNGGFQAEVTVSNRGSSPINGWTASWTWPGGQTINSLWNATYTQSGNTVTARNAPYNGTIPANGSVTFGLVGSGESATPSVSCSAA